MSDPRELDEAARRGALDVRRSILLQAPAGSGKTTVLVCRVLALLAAGEEPESILAITFSRKAAAEMRQRVLEALRDPARRQDPPELGQLARAALARDRERGWELLRNPARLRIQTFDALNQRLAAQAPVLAGGGTGFAVSENAGLLYQRAARLALESALADPELGAEAGRLFEHLDNRWAHIEGLLALLLECRLQWLPLVLDQPAESLADQVEQSLAAIATDAMHECLARWPGATDSEALQVLTTSADNLANGGDTSAETLGWRHNRTALCAAPGQLHRWRYLCRLLLTAGHDWRKSLNKNSGVPTTDAAFKRVASAWLARATEVPGLLPVLRTLATLPDLPLEPAERDTLQALALLMRHAVGILQVEFATRGQADFSYMAGAARQALSADGQPTDLALRVGAALRHLLVDEFQDTSSDQAQLLATLTAGWSDGDGRSLFLVGDPMQSIYQFRAADVGVFLQARSYGLGPLRLESMELRRNFRSGPGVVDWVNARMGPLFPPVDDVREAAIRYLPSSSARPELGGQVEVLARLRDADALVDAALEARQVLDIVRRERIARPGCSIAVLVAGRRHAMLIAASLQQHDIAVRGVKITPLAERVRVRDLLTLARVLQHFGDRTAWLSLLRSPLCGLELAELQALAEQQTRTLWSLIEDAALLQNLSPAARARVVRLHGALLPALFGEERQEPLHLRVERVWLRLGGAALCRDEADRADVRACLGALADATDLERLTGGACDALLDDLYADSGTAPNAVEILTMHAAKGLEWDVVIVPGLHHRQRANEGSLLEWLSLPRGVGSTDLLFGPIEAAGSNRQRSTSRYIRSLRKQRERLERVRRLYVTATRARCKLYLLCRANVDPKSGAAVPPGGSLLATLWQAVAPEFAQLTLPATAAAAPAATTTATATSATPLWRLPADWQAPAGAASPPVQRLPVSVSPAGTLPEYSWVGVSGRAAGTIIHAELQRRAQELAARVGGAVSVDESTWLTKEQYQGWLAELGVPAGERIASAQRILRALTETLADARGRWLLADAEHLAAFSEHRLTGVHDGAVVNIVIDRMLVDRDGTRWVIDFKTGGHEGSDIASFVEQEVERYYPQLQRYAALARHLGPEPVRCALYFPVLGIFRTLD